MNAAALRKIEAELLALVEAASDGAPIDPIDVRMIAQVVAAQAEMVEKGLGE